MKPDRFDPQTFDRLISTTGEHLVSIVIPTHRRGRQVSQDPIRLKNELSEIDEQLETLGVKPRDRAEKLGLAYDLLNDVEFWEHQLGQLAVYIDADNQMMTVATSEAVDEVPSMVCSRFQVRYLLPALAPVETVALVLSKNYVGLYRVDQEKANRLTADLPESFEDVNWFVDRETQRQQHPDRAGSSHNRHGHDPASERSEDMARFVRAVDRGIDQQNLEGGLVVLGDDRLVAEFARVHSEDVLGLPDAGVFDDDPVAIVSAVKPLIEEQIESRRLQASTDAEEKLGRGEASIHISESLSQAHEGRIGQVVIRRDTPPLWGVWNPQEGSADVQDRHRDAGDLLNQLVVETFKNGGQISVVTRTMDGHDFVAIQRY